MHFSDELVPVIETPQGLYETARVVSSVSLAGPGWAGLGCAGWPPAEEALLYAMPHDLAATQHTHR
jgi:hypothetical protein